MKITGLDVKIGRLGEDVLLSIHYFYEDGTDVLNVQHLTPEQAIEIGRQLREHGEALLSGGVSP